MKAGDTHRWKVPVLVACSHLVFVGLLFLLRPTSKPPIRPPAIRVGLASLPSPVSSRPHNPQTSSQSKQSKRSDRPKIKTSETGSRKISSRPTKKWKARTPEEIRKGIRTTPRKRSPRVAPPETRQLEMDQLRRMVRDFARDAHASNQHGEPTAVPDEYMEKVKVRLDALWRQPTRNEVDDRTHAVMVNIEVQRNGRVSASSITHPCGNVTVNQSVKALLNRLQTLPPLPTSIQNDVLRLDVVLRLE